MKLESHYIFLPKERVLKTEIKDLIISDVDGEILLNTPKGIYYYISNIFSVSPSKQEKQLFKKSYFADVQYNNVSYYVLFSQYDVGENIYLSIELEGKTKHQIVNCLEYIQQNILGSNIENEYYTIISYDAISEYYCNIIFPKLNSCERKLKRLLFNTYIVKFDEKYFETTISKEWQDKAKKNLKENAKSKKKERLIKESFYSLDLWDIKEILFTPTWKEYEQHEKESFLAENSDLSQLSDEELRKRFLDFSPKSDWERLFIDKTDETADSIESLIDEIRIFRNSIAHCKFFSSKDYYECSKQIRKLNRIIDQAIIITEEKDFLEKNSRIIVESFGDIIERFKELSRIIVHKTASLFRSEAFSNGLNNLAKVFGGNVDNEVDLNSITKESVEDDSKNESEKNEKENDEQNHNISDSDNDN